MAKMLQSGIGRAVLATVVAVVTTTSRAARAARSASRLAIFTIAAAAAVFAAIALTDDYANAQASSEVKSLSVGGDHACAVTEAGTIFCWGRNDAGQSNPFRSASTASGFHSVYLGEDYSCTLEEPSGSSTWLTTVMDCWGSEETNSFERFGHDAVWNPDLLGIDHGCRFRGSRDFFGRVSWTSISYGSNIYGQGDSDACEYYTLNGLAVGGWHNCIRYGDGSIDCYGRNDKGQAIDPATNKVYLSVDAGRKHTCAVNRSNEVECWGEDALGQSSPPSGSNYLEVSSNAFANFNCALTDERKVRCWGDNRYQQLNVPAAIAAPPPLEFTRQTEFINSRKFQPIGPFVLPPASGGSGHLSYNIAHTNSDDGERKKGPPAGLEFDETTRRLSGRVFDDVGDIRLHYIVSDTSGNTETQNIGLMINSAVPAGYAPAITWPELGTLDRGLIRCSALSEASRYQLSEDYTFRVASPSQLTIDAASEDFDILIILHKLDGSGDAWQDDDGGQGTDSRLTVGLAPARYQLSITNTEHNDEDYGAYTLRIRSPDFPAGNADADRECNEPPPPIQLDSASAGRIAARRIANGSIEFAWQVEGGDRILPRSRYLPADPPTGRWLNSSAIVVEGVDLGRINVRVNADTGRVEFAFTPAGGERILPPSRYFPSSAEAGVWLQSTIIEPGG